MQIFFQWKKSEIITEECHWLRKRTLMCWLSAYFFFFLTSVVRERKDGRHRPLSTFLTLFTRAADSADDLWKVFPTFFGRRNGRFLVCTCQNFLLYCVGLSTETDATVRRQHVIRKIYKLFLESFDMCTFMLGVTQKLSMKFSMILDCYNIFLKIFSSLMELNEKLEIKDNGFPFSGKWAV